MEEDESPRRRSPDVGSCSRKTTSLTCWISTLYLACFSAILIDDSMTVHHTSTACSPLDISDRSRPRWRLRSPSRVKVAEREVHGHKQQTGLKERKRKETRRREGPSGGCDLAKGTSYGTCRDVDGEPGLELTEGLSAVS